jgi:hypothetical protein
MKGLGVVLLMAALTPLAGCDEILNKPTTPAKQQERTSSPTHRFVLATRDVDLAFDTQTGELCRTWDWTPLAAAEKPLPGTGGVPERKRGEFTPTCLSLFQKYPTRNEPSDSVVLSQESNAN